MKVGDSSSAVPTSTTIAPEVIASIEVALAIEVSTAGVGSEPPMPSGPSNRDRALEAPAEGEVGKGRKEKKAITKMSRKACLSEADGDSDNRGKDPFDNLEIIRDLTRRFTMLEVVDYMADLDPLQLAWSSLGTILKSSHQMLVYIKRARRQEVQAQKVQEGLRAKICHLQGRVTEEVQAQKVQEGLRAKICHLQGRVTKVEHLIEEKAADIESLQGALPKKEFVSTRLKAALALEEERRKEAENKVAELKARMAKSISKAMTQAMKEFKTSSEMRNLNVEFSQEAFIKDFELCEGRVAQRFPKLDLSFLEEEEDEVDMGPSDAVVDPPFIEPASSPSESAVEVPKLVRGPKVVESAPAASSIAPIEVKILE
ncbi:hypothetical protein COCNU_16G000230 [Cocos nucifera]|uniref:Uncharacterized protein n=1 Tax=Cocos nucifera TaxID=13894 RepID=A0A8K0IXR3_COCNU|nr:hypothetical protein COCNU_16G000230 [Cocos nucifera]